MDVLTIAGITIVAALALLVARGVYLIGSGDAAEMQARQVGGGNEVVSAGWMTLDSLREGYVPGVSELEAWVDERRGGDDD